jgi:hypothetical protein
VAPFGSSLSVGRGLRLTTKVVDKAFKLAFDNTKLDIASANTKAMAEVSVIAKNLGRDSIRKGKGLFRGRWPNALRSKSYPEPGKPPSMGPAGLVYIASNYAGIFEQGGRVTGKPYIWIPLPGVPPYFMGEHIHPGQINGIVSMKIPGKPPLLGIRIKGTKRDRKITTTLLKSGTYEKATTKRGAKKKYMVIPLFVGVRKADIPKKWDLQRAAKLAMLQLNSKVGKNLRTKRG